jgi:hypothetical protein
MSTDREAAVAELVSIFGPPSQNGFGSAVFADPAPGAILEQAALASYRRFVGELWDRYGERAWMGPWRRVYQREPGTAPAIVSELAGLEDPDARLSVPLLLDAGPDPARAHPALAGVFDDPGVTVLEVFAIGDGAAMSGLVVAGQDRSGASTCLIVLMD